MEALINETGLREDHQPVAIAAPAVINRVEYFSLMIRLRNYYAKNYLLTGIGGVIIGLYFLLPR